MTKIEKLLDIIYHSALQRNQFAEYDATKKIVFHKENFINFLKGNDLDIIPSTIGIVPSLECNQRCPRCTYWQNQSKCKTGINRIMSDKTFNKFDLSNGSFISIPIISSMINLPGVVVLPSIIIG